ncbi:MAG: sulfate adenylyltransferase subunit 2 [Nitrospinae bacterium]|nr:sulfate adenylyltransferase subunit 2 [Nitrospinota bacterium]
MDHLSELENQSIYILREAYKNFENLAMLWSIGKDSTVMVWLARKAFFGHCPLPLVHIDTSYKIPKMIEYRDLFAKKWGLNLVIGQNKKALDEGMNHTLGRMTCCEALKTQGLQQIMEVKGYTGLILGIRRDEEGTRAKERYFSPRDKNFEWNFKDQPPELWDQFKTTFAEGTHIRIHPLLHWTELNVWEYIEREKIPIIDLYFANEENKRYRSLGCAPCTGTIDSTARNVPEIIEELKEMTTSERAGRAQDQENTYAMQKLRAKGYM